MLTTGGAVLLTTGGATFKGSRMTDQEPGTLGELISRLIRQGESGERAFEILKRKLREGDNSRQQKPKVPPLGTGVE
jgi:hypothetical protein